MTFFPVPFAARRRGPVVLAALLVVLGSAVWIIAALPPSGLVFALLLATLALAIAWVYLAWRAWACLSLCYWLDRNAVTVVWGPLRQVIPLPAIREVRRHMQAPPELSQPLRWPWLDKWLLYGRDLNKVRAVHSPGATPAAAGRAVICLASRPLTEQLVLVTDQGAFGISPADPDAFLAALEAHHQLGPTRPLPVERRHPPLWEARVWRDRWALSLLAAGGLGGLLLLGLVMVRYPSLPDLLPAPQSLPKSSLFLFPAFGFAVWLLNGLWGLAIYHSQRVAALLLWAGALVGQAAALAALQVLT